ncbi:UNVERIFIED_ORG: hypothetical protein QE434_004771 [Rhizobium sp. SORGH_AS 755]|nr:hypothetical protein [Rhizobium sp. SORGH_AS_0755]
MIAQFFEPLPYSGSRPRKGVHQLLLFDLLIKLDFALDITKLLRGNFYGELSHITNIKFKSTCIVMFVSGKETPSGWSAAE